MTRRLFLDTEWTAAPWSAPAELMWIGLADEAGRAWYGISSEVEIDPANNAFVAGAFRLITPDELPAGCEGLRIQSRLNGKIMQDANTKDFLWNIVESLVIISECMTLEPGDVIITGTPAGVGYARNPPVFMAPGDVIEIEVDGMGVLMNTIVDEK